MANKYEMRNYFMNVALLSSKLSKCERNKVGSIAVKNKNIIGIAFNGTPNGYYTNLCELPDGSTNPITLHAEQNLICKLASGKESLYQADIYCTLSPCTNCAKMLYQAGIKNFFYLRLYRCQRGLNLLKELNVHCEQIHLEN